MSQELKVIIKELPIGLIDENDGQIPECFKAEVQESDGNTAIYIDDEL